MKSEVPNSKNNDLNKRLIPSLLQTISSEELLDTVSDIGEIAIDSVFDEGLFRDIPIISTIITIGKTGLRIRERFLIKKILAFLSELNRIPEDERAEFQNKVSNDPPFADRVGESIIVLLDKFETVDKSKLLALLFSACIKNIISVDDFWRFSIGLERSFLQDIQAMLDFYRGKLKSKEVNWESLFSNGFSSIRLNINTFPEHGGIPSLGYGEMVLFGPSPSSERFAQAIIDFDDMNG